MQHVNLRHQFDLLEARWNALCDQYLFPAAEGSKWRSLAPDQTRSLPSQGWKIHISATILNACDVLEAVIPILVKHNVTFKVVRNLGELSKLNCGLQYGYSQIGKAITVYPCQGNEKQIAIDLVCATSAFSCPAVPFEKRLGNSCVFYRYGAFNGLEITSPNGQRISDSRDGSPPDWAEDPFLDIAPGGGESIPILELKNRFRIFDCISQRGKGGVYLAFDLEQGCMCILKEGRAHGEVDLLGRDGYWRINNEYRFLQTTAASRANFPRPYAVFGNNSFRYLAIELIEGENLARIVRKTKRPDLARCQKLAVDAEFVVSEMHKCGIAWRDCKPLNFILETNSGSLRPIDLEGACLIDDPDLLRWGTEQYMLPGDGIDPRALDTYALGITLGEIYFGAGFRKEDLARKRRAPMSVIHKIEDLLRLTPGSVYS